MDHHATTPVDRRVMEAMRPYFEQQYGNAASRTHRFGKVARDAVERARLQVAGLIESRPDEVIFTSGATESDNLALKGVAAALSDRGNHIVTVRTEHKAILDSCAALEQAGFRVTYLDVDERGFVDLDALARAITDQTILVSAMLCNNEIGVVQDIEGIGALARDRGVVFHCDAAQGLGYLPFSVRTTQADLVSLSAHKLYGPKGVGALFVSRSLQRRGVPTPLIDGGGHEGGFRSGTLNVPGIVGFGSAAAFMMEQGPAEAARIAALRDLLMQRLLDELEEVRLNGSPTPRHPGNLNLSFGFVDGAKLLLELSDTVAVSSGAACSSATDGPSYVLEAMGVPKAWAAASVRFGLGRHNTESEVNTVADRVVSVVRELRDRSAEWELHREGTQIDW